MSIHEAAELGSQLILGGIAAAYVSYLIWNWFF